MPNQNIEFIDLADLELDKLNPRLPSSHKKDGITKKEILMLTREKDKLERGIGGIKDMGGIPDALFIIDVGYEKIAIQEANKLGIPVIGIVDTNNSPENIDYIIPANDDGYRAIRMYMRDAINIILEAQQANKPAPSPAQMAEAKEAKEKVVIAKKNIPPAEEAGDQTAAS